MSLSLDLDIMLFRNVYVEMIETLSRKKKSTFSTLDKLKCQKL